MPAGPRPTVTRQEHDAGWIEFARAPTPPGLAGLVAGRCGNHELALRETVRRLPATCLVPVIITFGDRQHVVAAVGGEGAGRSYGSLAAGLRAGHTLTRFRGEQACVQVYLTPLGVQQVLGLPGGELANRVLDLEDVAPSLAALAGRLEETRTWEERLALVDRELLTLAERGRPADAVSRQLWHDLRASRGAARIRDLAARTGYSQRLVSGRFGSEVGLGPKAVGRLLRFEHAAGAIAAGTPIAEAAATHGYADQSHLTREFARLGGTTPAGWAAAPPPSPHLALGRTPAGTGPRRGRQR